MIVEIRSVDERCVPIAGSFPSGFDMLPGGRGHAVVVQQTPAALIALDLNSEPASMLATDEILPLPPDSDGDGVEDGARSRSLGFPPLVPIVGSALAVSEELAFVSASSYEEVIFFEVPSGALTQLWVENPSSTPSDYPLLPEQAELRSAVSTRACVYPPDPTDSLGDAIGPEPRCNPDVPGYFTNYTAGRAVAAGYLFVVTSNLRRSSEARFNPGTVLVYEFDPLSSPPTLRPDAVIFTSRFNPTGATHYTAFPDGEPRELVLVSVTGAIGLEGGADTVKSESAIDVIDAEARCLVATIPLGMAGISFGELAIDPKGRVALMGAISRRQLYAVDLAPLDDSRLYQDCETPVVLDGGTDPLFPDDPRIFTASSPFEIPARSDGQSPEDCDTTETYVAINDEGSLAFATDFCDGTLAVIELAIPYGEPRDGECEESDPCCNRVPLPPACFHLRRLENVLAPNSEDAVTELRGPVLVQVRPGRPGVDYTGPDVFFVAGLPEGQVCGVHIESFAPSP
jgi:hypothetical protein